MVYPTIDLSIKQAEFLTKYLYYTVLPWPVIMILFPPHLFLYTSKHAKINIAFLFCSLENQRFGRGSFPFRFICDQIYNVVIRF